VCELLPDSLNFKIWQQTAALPHTLHLTEFVDSESPAFICIHLCFCVVSASSGRMTLTGGAAEEKEQKVASLNLDFGHYCFSFLSVLFQRQVVE